jgi:hypothetical protein
MIKLTAFVSVIAASAITLAACSSGTNSGVPGTPVADSGATKPDAKPATPDAGPKPDSAVVAPATCGPTKVDYAGLTKEVPNSAANAGACTVADVAAAREAIKGIKTAADLAKIFPGSCGQCVNTFFTDGQQGTETPWSSFVFFKDAAGDINGYVNNTNAACVATKTKNAECAKAVSVFDVCKNVACSKCTDQTESTDCETAAYDQDTGTCSTQGGPELQSACKSLTKPNDIGTLLGAGGGCAGGKNDKSNGDVWISVAGAACGVPAN